ncbi:hypothetical protein LTR28_011862, partial [Elasticomyces elasticus]
MTGSGMAQDVTEPVRKRRRTSGPATAIFGDRTVSAPTAPVDPEAAEAKKRALEAHQEYGRGKKIRTHSIKDRKLRGNLRALEQKYEDATLKAKDAEILLEHTSGLLEPETELERTYKVRQEDIRRD